MNRRHFLETALSLSIVALVAGCGGGGGGSSPSPAGQGAAQGFVFRAADGALRLFRTAAEGVAAGLTPAAGARAQIVDGPAATVAADGSLTLTGIPAGLRTLTIGTATFALTVVPNATLPLGETPIARADAVAAVRSLVQGGPDAELLEAADILATATPLPAGVVLGAGLPAGSRSDLPRTLARPAWLIYVDLAPSARFGHPTFVALVDAQSGAVDARSSLSWPTLNGARFYDQGTANATSPDAVQVAPRPAAGRAAPTSWSVGKAAQGATCRAADPDTSRAHVLMVQGDSREDFAADMRRVDLALSAAPFPKIGTLRKLVTFRETATAVQRVLEEFAAVRDACKSGDTFVLFVTAHGTIDRDPYGDTPTAEEAAATYETLVDNSSFQAEKLKPGDLDFSSCKACRIVLWIDTCYSGNWIPLLAPQLEALEHKDILILTAADQFHQAGGLEYSQPLTVEGASITLGMGGAFSSSLLESLSRVRATGTAETGVDALESAFGFARTLTNTQNYLWIPARTPPLNRRLQSPQLFRRPLEPDDVCGRGDQEVTVR
jgi:hypothetical protein